MPCIFVISVVTRTSVQTRLRNVSDFRDLNFCLSAVIFMPYVHVATVRSMLLLSMFSKDDLDIWLDLSIHAPACIFGVA